MDKEPSVSRTQSNIQERALSKSTQRPRAVNYFRKSSMSDARLDSEYASGLAAASYELKHIE